MCRPWIFEVYQTPYIYFASTTPRVLVLILELYVQAMNIQHIRYPFHENISSVTLIGSCMLKYHNYRPRDCILPEAGPYSWVISRIYSLPSRNYYSNNAIGFSIVFYFLLVVVVLPPENVVSDDDITTGGDMITKARQAAMCTTHSINEKRLHNFYPGNLPLLGDYFLTSSLTHLLTHSLPHSVSNVVL
jgi:hypothetical protein